MVNDKLHNLNDNIITIEKDISDLVNIFEDLQTIVNSQSNMLDSIEDNIISSSEDTNEATEVLIKCDKKSKKKKKFIFKIVGGSIVVIPIVCTPIFLPILGTKLVLGGLLGTTSIGTTIYAFVNKKK